MRTILSSSGVMVAAMAILGLVTIITPVAAGSCGPQQCASCMDQGNCTQWQMYCSWDNGRGTCGPAATPVPATPAPQSGGGSNGTNCQQYMNEKQMCEQHQGVCVWQPTGNSSTMGYCMPASNPTPSPTPAGGSGGNNTNHSGVTCSNYNNERQVCIQYPNHCHWEGTTTAGMCKQGHAPAATPAPATPAPQSGPGGNNSGNVNCSMYNHQPNTCNYYSNHCQYENATGMCKPAGSTNPQHCDTYNSPSLCQMYSHCMWKQQSSTNPTAHCAPKPAGATPMPTTPAPGTNTYPCDYYHTPSQCQMYSHCKWEETTSNPNGTCVANGNTPTPTTPAPGGANQYPCHVYNTSNWCAMYSHCMWRQPSSAHPNGTCIAKTGPGGQTPMPGTPAPGTNTYPCYYYQSPNQCHMYSHCKWEETTSNPNGTCVAKTGPGGQTPMPTTPAPGTNQYPCYYYQNPSTCGMYSHCMWHETSSNPNGTCVAKTTGDACSSYSMQVCYSKYNMCHWKEGMCKLGRCTAGCACYLQDKCSMYATSQGCEWTGQACQRKPQNNNTLPPTADCESLYQEAPCKSQSTCYWYLVNVPGSTEPRGKCAVKPCMAYSASECPNRCVVDANRCIPPPCWNNTQYSCGKRAACMWKDASSLDAETGACVPKTCDMLANNADACKASPRCWWSNMNNTCVDLPCTTATCYSSICKWNYPATGGSTNGGMTCKPKTCAQYDFNSCPRNLCRVNSDNQCEAQKCVNLSPYRAACLARPDCTGSWKTNAGSTHTYWMCENKPCNTHTSMVNCRASNCHVDNATQTCHYPSCVSSFTSEARCRWNPTCWWNANATTALERCNPTSCSSRSITTCTRPCDWNRETNKCEKKQCTDFTTAASCPSSSGVCGWSSDIELCVSTDCGRAEQDADKCQQMSDKCFFLQGKGCIDKNVRTNIQCSKSTSQLQCLDFTLPVGRCNWTNVPGTNHFSCAPTPAAGTQKKCYEFAKGSTCPTYCVSKYGYCIDPRCRSLNVASVSLTDNEKKAQCAKWMCRWNMESCQDSRSGMFPCDAYSNNTMNGPCPAGRCVYNQNTKFCGVPGSTGGNTGGNDNTPKKCSDITDVAECSAAGSCIFNTATAACTVRTCDQYSDEDSCPTETCKWRDDACHKPCPADRAVFCPNLGTCVTDRSKCVGCPSTKTTCWNGECKDNFLQCPCPTTRPHRCNGTAAACVSDAAQCTTACPVGAVRCWNNDCAESYAHCPCPTTRPTKCNVTGKVWCGVNRESCEFKCPATAPYKCEDGACALNEMSCACPRSMPHRCLTDRKCYATQDACPCREGTKRCSGSNKCIPTADSCNPTTVQTPKPAVACPATTPFMCTDGTCVKQRYDCLDCADKNEAMPEVEILTDRDTFDVSQWTRLYVNATYVVCGVNIGWKLDLSWSVYNPKTGKVVTLPSTANTQGRLLSIPPKALSAGETFAFSALAKIPGVSFASSAIVKMTGYAPKPEFSILGGDRTFPAGERLNFGTNLVDRVDMLSKTNGITWVCSMNNGLSDCPTQLSAGFNAAWGRSVSCGDVPAGVYTVTAYYKNVNSTVTISVKAAEEGKSLPPRVNLISMINKDRIFVGSELRMYAICNNPNSTITWMINGQTFDFVGRAVKFPADKFTAGTKYTIKAIATNPDGVIGYSTLTITPKAEPTVQCKVVATSGAESNGDFRALKTRVRLSAPAYTGITEKVQYRFGYFKKDANDREFETKVSNFWQDLNYVDFTAPITTNNMNQNIVFGAAIRVVGSTTIIRSKCTAVQVVAAATKDLEEETTANVYELDTTNDTTTAVRAASRVASTLTVSSTDAKAARENKVKVVAGLEKAATQAKETMSATERGQVVRAMQNVMASNDNEAKTNATSAKQFIRDNAAKILQMLKAVLSATDGEDDLNVETEGDATLEVLSKARVAGQTDQNIEIASEINKLSRKFARAAKTTLGVAKKMRQANVTVTGLAKSAVELAETKFGDERSGCKFPTGFSLPETNSTSTVQLSSVAYDENPVGEAGKPDNSVLVGSVSDFHVQLDDKDHKIENMSPPMEITFTLSEEEAQGKTDNSQFKCRYFDHDTKQWSATGCQFKGYNSTSRTVKCTSDHLSTFGGFADNEAATSGTSDAATPAPNAASSNAGTPAPNGAGSTPAPAGSNGGSTPAPGGNGATPAPASGSGATPVPATTTATPGATPNPTTNNNGNTNGGGAATGGNDDDATMGAIIGGSIGGVVLLAILALVVIKMMKKDDKNPDDDDNNEMPMLNAPSMNQRHDENVL